MLGGPVLDDQLEQFHELGDLAMPQRFDHAHVELLRQAMNDERHSQTVRSVYGSHRRNALFARLVALDDFVGACEQLGVSVSVHQLKINTKAALLGDLWPWQHGYIVWQPEDRMPRPDILNLLVFLDDVTEFNGPLMFIAGSHRFGVLHHCRELAWSGELVASKGPAGTARVAPQPRSTRRDRTSRSSIVG